jgi:hypothetical protein
MMRKDPFGDFDDMANRMMSNFGMPKMEIGLRGGGMFGGDPFANDPFFSDHGFGGMDKMMKNMKN